LVAKKSYLFQGWGAIIWELIQIKPKAKLWEIGAATNSIGKARG